MNRDSNLILIGMPASGKSTVGLLAAKALELDFHDTDLLLQRREGQALHRLLAQYGPLEFLARENELLATLEVTRSVVSTGGSAVYHSAGMKNLKSQGRVIWIDVPFAELERRLGDISTRGVVLAPGQTLRQLYDERQSLYAHWADIRLEAGREVLETTVSKLVQRVK